MQTSILAFGLLELLLSTTAPLALGINQEVVSRGVVQLAVAAARTQMDVTYDSLIYDPRARSTTLHGLRLAPPVSAGMPGCEMTAASVTLKPELSFDRVSLDLEAFESRVEVSCLASALGTTPEAMAEAGMPPPLAALGEDLLHMPYASFSAAHDFAQSGLEVSGEAETRALGRFEMSFSLDRLHATENRYGPPVDGRLLDAEFSLDASETAQALAPMFVQQALGMRAQEIRPTIEGVMGEIPGEAERGNKDEHAFVESLVRELERFSEEGGKLVLALDPPQPFQISNVDAMAGPRDLIVALRPELRAEATGAAGIIEIAVLSAALEGEDLSEEDRRRVGEALLSGVGAPRSIDAALKVLEPLLEANDPAAARAAAEALAEIEPESAYAFALIAAAGGATGAPSLADRLELGLSLEAAVQIQEGISRRDGLDGVRDEVERAVTQDPTVDGLRALARSLMRGDGRPRHYAAAYMLASLAAAAGDLPSARMRDGLAARYAQGDDAEAWRNFAVEAEGETLEIWLRAGLGEALAE